MRKVVDMQLTIWGIDIGEVELDDKSRDEIPQVLSGLKHIWNSREKRDEVFEILKSAVPEGTDRNNGRPGMDLWKILVLATLRLACNCDYDKVKELADNHKKVRNMMGHDDLDQTAYPLQTIKDNISMLTPEIMDKISRIVVNAGHEAAGKKEGESLKGRCDSMPVETNVHFPTDISLLFDVSKSVIRLTGILCSELEDSEWRRNHDYLLKTKRAYHKARNLKRSTSKDEGKTAEREKIIAGAHQSYIDLAGSYIGKAKSTIERLRGKEGFDEGKAGEIREFIDYGELFIDQIERRVIGGEKIPQGEKVFSVFQEHTEWIKKGKAGVRQELGLNVCIVEDQYRFILHHHVMQGETDDKIAVKMVKETQERFPDFRECSFDKGFWSPENRRVLDEMLDLAVLPKKGRLSSERKEIESAEEFVRARRRHSAVESALNALENHGLDRCPDSGIDGFKRYVSLAVLARNLQILGCMVREKEQRRQRRIEKYRKTWNENRLAA